MFSLGEGSIYRLLNKNIKEFNKIKLSILCIVFLLSVGFISYKINSSYALFSDSIVGNNTIEISPNLSLDKSGANEPLLDEGMIPVYYDSTNNVWKKADKTNRNKSYKWYDYANKMWANSVTVSSTNRNKYLSTEPGTEIPMSDILTMQVWIPRYKYKVWNYNADGTKTSNEQQIEITWESGVDKTGEISCQDSISGTDGAPSETCKLKATNATCTDSTCNNKTYTHPAFTFGNEELKGFWIGKFELTGTISNITTKPNLSSLRSQTISSFETNIMSMKDSSNQYGFSTNTDTHMIKNSEWGAVAYLSHSKYGTCTDGICKEIGINNNSNYITGCGAEPGSSSSTTCNSYNTTLGNIASTTGNIYGVYDMSGGSNDYTMGNIIYLDGKKLIAGYSDSYNSGYSGLLYNDGKFTTYSGISYPNNKYYDRYSYNTSDQSKIQSKLGESIKEVYSKNDIGWYGDYSQMANSLYSWFVRSGYHGDEDHAGLFFSYNANGRAYINYSTRLIITP